MADRRHPGLRQYLEMFVAMCVGVVVLGMMVRAALAVAGLTYSHTRYPELAALKMTTTMAAGMAAWMRYRGHGWRAPWRCALPCSHPP